MVTKKIQHYIPKFYLKGFSENGYIYAYDRIKNSYKKQSIKSTACVEDYYTARKLDGSKNKEIEDFFNMFETRAKYVIEKIEKQERINEEDKVYLSLFVSYLRVRVPEFEKFFNESGKKILGKHIDEIMINPELMRHIIKNYENDTGKKIEYSAEELINSVGSYEIKIPKEYRLQSMLDFGYEQGILIFNMDWLVQCAHKESSFITSDNSFILFSQDFNNDSKPIGLITPKTHKVIPLTHKSILIIGDVHGRTSIFEYIKENLTKEGTRLVNEIIAINCDRFIFAKDEPLLRKIVSTTNIDKIRVSSRAQVEYDKNTEIIRLSKKNLLEEK